ncbi:MAG: hypothetical protein JWM42_720 [Burkholderia sp.]|nr:hypothetical protein [Burkholderia sp.]
MKSIRHFGLFVVLCCVAGCANLEEVQSFAAESAKLSAYAELTVRFRDTYEREKPYLTDEADRIAKDNDKMRKEAYADLVKIHQGVSLYMQTLAKLAGDDTFDLTRPIGTLASGIRAFPDLGIQKSHVDAYFSLTRIITRWTGTGYQLRAVKSMLVEADAPIQTLLDGMLALANYYEKTNENERGTVLGLLEVEIPFANASKDRLLSTLAKAHMQAKSSEYQTAKRKYSEAARGLRSIAEGHRELAANVDKLPDQQTRAMVEKFAKDIQTVRDNLNTIGW